MARSTVAGPASSALAAGGHLRPRAGVRTLAQVASRLRGGLFVPLDLAASGAAMLLAYLTTPVFMGERLVQPTYEVALAYAVAVAACGHAVGLYDWNAAARRGLVARRAVLAVLSGAILTLAYFYLAFYRPIGRWVMLAATAYGCALLLLPRAALWYLTHTRRRCVLFVGDGPLVQETVAALEAHFRRLYDVLRLPGEADPDALALLVQQREIDEVVVPGGPDAAARLLPALLRCLPLGCQVRSEADFYEDAFRSVPVRAVTADWLLGRGFDTSNHVFEAVKRTVDGLVAAALLVLLAPLLLLAAVAVRLADGGPAFYSQLRLGRYGTPFRIFKLRTMRPDAEGGEARWAEPDDPRRTRLGALLRRTRLDELPQLWNILRGEMSFVGPRPERPELALELEASLPYYAWRHTVRPGLTGWAQINLPYGASVEDARRKLEFDLYYVRNSSLVMDLLIALRTLTAALAGGR